MNFLQSPSINYISLNVQANSGMGAEGRGFQSMLISLRQLGHTSETAESGFQASVYKMGILYLQVQIVCVAF